MNCHYSCLTCSLSYSISSCLTCPSTRQLKNSLCVCQTDFYEAQQANCTPAQDASYLIKMIRPMGVGLYITNIVLFWLFAIIVISRFNSAKLRAALTFGQSIALILNYPFLLDELANTFIWSISSLNFNYFSDIVDCQQDLACQIGIQILQPLLVFPCLIGCFIIAFIFLNLFYAKQLQREMSLLYFWAINWFGVCFMFVDYTAIIFSYNLTKGIMLSNYGIIPAVIYALAVFVILLKFFRIVNHHRQVKVVYRADNVWAFGYDENYHLHFIDFLYTEAKPHAKQKPKSQPHIYDTQYVSDQGKFAEEAEDIIHRFTPHSNLYIFQILFKFLMGISTAILFQYKPSLIVIPLVILLLIMGCWMGVFFYYDRSNMCVYYLMALLCMVCSVTYWISAFWVIALVAAWMITVTFGLVIVTMPFMNLRLHSNVVNRTLLDQEAVSENMEEESSIKLLDQQNKTDLKSLASNQASQNGEQIKNEEMESKRAKEKDMKPATALTKQSKKPIEEHILSPMEEQSEEDFNSKKKKILKIGNTGAQGQKQVQRKRNDFKNKIKKSEPDSDSDEDDRPQFANKSSSKPTVFDVLHTQNSEGEVVKSKKNTNVQED